MNIIIPTQTPDGREVKAIGIWMSGGADSSLLAYLLAKHIKESGSTIKFIGMTVRRPRPTNPIYAAEVVEKIEELLDFSIDHRIMYPEITPGYQGNADIDKYADDQYFRDQNALNFSSGEFQILYSGITMNPPQDVQLTFIDGISDQEGKRGEAIDNPTELFNPRNNHWIIDPFRKMNKKQLAAIYEEEGITDTLFPVTRSCEHMEIWTHHCGRCWWCEERMWAFGRLE